MPLSTAMVTLASIPLLSNHPPAWATEADTEAYWSMYDGGSGGSDDAYGVSEKTRRANPPIMAKEKVDLYPVG